jgi:DNA-binding CsgD family transcriptional regulator
MSAQMTNHFARNFVTGRTPSENPASLLSERELGIFRLIGHGKGTAEIAGTLQISAKTVGAHREHIKEKLNLRNAAELLQRASEWVRRGLAILLGLLLFVSAVQLRYPSATRAPTASKRSCAPSHQFQSAFHFPVCRFGFAC